MHSVDPRKWLLLIHQIPPKPTALRVKIWRRLQQVGAVAVKPSVYLMPLSEQSREDLSWILKEITEGGGDGSISEARFVEGLSDEQILAMFQTARKLDYEKLIKDTNTLLSDWSSRGNISRDIPIKGQGQLTRLHRHLVDITSIDFFQAPKRVTAELLIKKLGNSLTGQAPADIYARDRIANFTGKTWVTRGNLYVDRIACGWLIRRFIDQEAVFKFVPGSQYSPKSDEIQFDMFDGEYTHKGDRCTFEVMIQHFQIQDYALCPIAEIVHDIDLKDQKYARSETDGFSALLMGLVTAHPDDEHRMTEGYRLFDNLYTYFQRQKSE